MKIQAKIALGLLILLFVVGGYLLYSLRNSGDSGPAPKSPVTKTHNKNSSAYGFNDINFAQQMIVQSQQGILISEAAYRSAINQEVRNVAFKNMEQQKSDLNAYKALLETWNESYLNLVDYPEIEGHDLYPTFPGMADLTELKNIQTKSGEYIDRLYLELAVRHAEGVLEMADTVGAGSENTEINQIKNNAISKQKSIIDELSLLKSTLDKI